MHICGKFMFDYHPKLIEHMISQTSKAVLGLTVVSSVYVWVYFDYIPLAFLLTWIFAQALFIIFRFYNAKILTACVKNNDSTNIKRHIIYFTLALSCSALIWSAATILGVIFAPQPYEFIGLVMIIGITTAGVLSLTSIFYAYLIYFLLMILPQFAIMLYYGSPAHVSVAPFLLIYMPIIVLLSKYIYTNHLHNIATNESLEANVQRLHELATTDSLTGLYNRRHFFEASQHIIAISQRDKKELSLLMVDIDYFKNVNDTYGHQAGDAVLVSLSKEIRGLIRESDMVARLGGEEFAILLHNTSMQGAKVIAEKVRAVIESKKNIYNHNTVAITISLGVASLDKQITNIDELYQMADTQLYKAKELGRNRVC